MFLSTFVRASICCRLIFIFLCQEVKIFEDRDVFILAISLPELFRSPFLWGTSLHLTIRSRIFESFADLHWSHIQYTLVLQFRLVRIFILLEFFILVESKLEITGALIWFSFIAKYTWLVYLALLILRSWKIKLKRIYILWKLIYLSLFQFILNFIRVELHYYFIPNVSLLVGLHRLLYDNGLLFVFLIC